MTRGLLAKKFETEWKRGSAFNEWMLMLSLADIAIDVLSPPILEGDEALIMNAIHRECMHWAGSAARDDKARQLLALSERYRTNVTLAKHRETRLKVLEDLIQQYFRATDLKVMDASRQTILDLINDRQMEIHNLHAGA